MIALAGVASEATFVSTASDDDEEEVGTVIDPARPTTLTNTATAPQTPTAIWSGRQFDASRGCSSIREMATGSSLARFALSAD